MQRILLCLALLLGCLTFAQAQTPSAQAVRDSLRWELVLSAYQRFCDLSVDARSGDREARTALRPQADSISLLLGQVKGSKMTPAQQKRFLRMKSLYSNVVALPDLMVAQEPVSVPTATRQPQFVSGQTVIIRDTVIVVREVHQTDTVRIVEQVEKVVEVPVEVPVEVQVPVEVPIVAPRPGTHYLFLVQAVVPDLSFGAMAGVMRQAGIYARFDSNFRRGNADYSCNSHGEAPYGQIWTSGRSILSRFSVSGGVIWHPLAWLSAYAGAGYGERSLYWEDIAGRWAMVSDASCRSVAADLGLVFNLDHFVISAAVNTIAFHRFDGYLGIGIFF
jgi:opacity protein-like surface antigen